MDTRRVQGARHDLHRVRMRSIASDGDQIAPTVHQHPMPSEQLSIVQRRRMIAIEIGRHFGRTRLRRIGATAILREAEMPGD